MHNYIAVVAGGTTFINALLSNQQNLLSLPHFRNETEQSEKTLLHLILFVKDQTSRNDGANNCVKTR